MPRQSKSNYVSLNHIRKALDHGELNRKKGLDLIHAFFPDWSDKPFAHTDDKAVDTFCCGNRKGQYLANTIELNYLIEKLRASDSDYVDRMLQMLKETVPQAVGLNESHPVFSLELVSKDHPSPSEQTQFAMLKGVIHDLIKTNSPESLNYALFLLVIVGVLQERITEVSRLYQWAFIREKVSVPSQMPQNKDIDDPQVLTDPTANISSGDVWVPPVRALAFFKEVLDRYSGADIQSIDMAFHSGEHWLIDGEKTDFMHQIAAMGIPLRILINSGKAARALSLHTRRDMQSSVDFKKVRQDWAQWPKRYPGLIEVRILDIPLLHRTYLVRRKNHTGAANITFYTYGTGTNKKDLRRCFTDAGPEYALFSSEFDYLWEIAERC